MIRDERGDEDEPPPPERFKTAAENGRLVVAPITPVGIESYAPHEDKQGEH
jgi:hypothetical protein